MSNLPQWLYIRNNEHTGKWFGADSMEGPWQPIPAPQRPERLWPMPAPAAEPPEGAPSYADRLALAVCPWREKTMPTGEPICTVVCKLCRSRSAAVAHEVATILRERHGSSATADWLDGVGCHG